MADKRHKMATENEIRAYWREIDPERYGDGDEHCFGCGITWPNKDGSPSRCERAHILPRVEGGADTAENLHMLCHVCHRSSEHLSGDRYWDWLNGWTVVDMAVQALSRRGWPVASVLSRQKPDGIKALTNRLRAEVVRDH